MVAMVYDSRVKVRCVMCAGEFVIPVMGDDYFAFISGSGYVQDIFPYLSASERELLISGTCGKCFDSLFSDVDNDE